MRKMELRKIGTGRIVVKIVHEIRKFVYKLD